MKVKTNGFTKWIMIVGLFAPASAFCAGINWNGPADGAAISCPFNTQKNDALHAASGNSAQVADSAPAPVTHSKSKATSLN